MTGGETRSPGAASEHGEQRGSRDGHEKTTTGGETRSPGAASEHGEQRGSRDGHEKTTTGGETRSPGAASEHGEQRGSRDGHEKTTTGGETRSSGAASEHGGDETTYRSPIPPRWVGWVLALFTTALVLANQQEVGIARDETVYMTYGVRYAKWWMHLPSNLSKDKITQSWGGPHPTDNNREHPPLIKTLAGFSHEILYRGLGIDEVTAFRLPSAVLHGLLVLLAYLMVLELWGFAEAIVAALLITFLPRALFHAGLLAFDAPSMTLWFATIYAYWRALGTEKKYPWQVGVVFGLALATKHTALLMPFALVPHYLIVGFRQHGRRLVIYRWRVIVSFVVLAPLTLFVLWPWLWLDPIDHVRDWLMFHLHHTHYNFEYLGENWNAPPFPWHVALVTTLFTVPVATLVAGLIGTVRWIAARTRVADPRLPGLLLVLSAAASIGPFFLGSTPIFGAEKHWMPMLPSLCIAAGVGTVWAARMLASLVGERWRNTVAVAACTLVVAAPLVETITAQPYALSWYNTLAGEAPGGADLGMNRQFWGVAARGVLPVLEAEGWTGPAPKKCMPPATACVYSHDASPAWGKYIERGEIPAAMRDSGHELAGIAASTYALVIHEKHFNRHDYLIWRTYGTVQPMFVLRTHGVPIVSVYKRPRLRK